MAVTNLEIKSRRPAGGGQTFGDVGAYEQLEGTVSFAVDPKHPLNSCVTDVELAPPGADACVHFSADFSILRPVSALRGNRRLLCGVPNRGRKLTGMFNFTPPLTAGQIEPEGGPNLGDGLLMRNGWTVIECGWEWGLPPGRGQLRAELPEADVTGKTMLDWQPGQAGFSLPFSYGLRSAQRLYPTMDLNDPEAVLTVRDNPSVPAEVIERRLWSFARVQDGQVVPDATSVYLSTGFQQARIYELVYRAHGAPVLGLGMLGIRDIASFLRYASSADGNPCAGSLDRAYTFGVSQTGTLLRRFLYLGLNEDERERQVFDGVFALVSGATRGENNQRFGVGSGGGSTGTGKAFPHSFGVETDPVSGKTDSILNRLERRRKAPKVFQVNSANEYWRVGASLIHIDGKAERDLQIPESVRVYMMAGAHHTNGVPVLSNVSATGDRTRYSINTLAYAPLLRAMLVNLDRWVSEGIEPPRSSHPRLSDGTAVQPSHLVRTFPAIPGFSLPKHVPRMPRLDFGQGSAEGIPANLPGKPSGEDYKTLVSAVDKDGNEVSGLRLPDLTVPLAAYTGWNLRHPEAGGADQITGLVGGTLPFPRDAAERRATGDSRRSIAERYSSKENYLDQFRTAAVALVKARHILAEDVERMVDGASQRWDLFIKKTS